MKFKHIAIFLSLSMAGFMTKSFAYNDSLFGSGSGSGNNTQIKNQQQTTISVSNTPISVETKPIVSAQPIAPKTKNKPLFAETQTAQVNNNKIILVPIAEQTPKTKMRLPSEFENIPPLTKWVSYNEYLKEQKNKKVQQPDQPTNELIQQANKDPSKYVDNFFNYNKQSTPNQNNNSNDSQIKSGMGALLSQYGVGHTKPVTNNGNSEPEPSMNFMAQRFVPLPHAIDGDTIPDSQLGKKVYIRIFKKEHSLELYLLQGSTYQLANIYDICTYYGGLGNKKKTGDNKSPEGFYTADKESLNPNSSYYKAINIGFPNAYDREHGYTGKYLMIHGGCKSIGCYAMTNSYIKEIYKFVLAAFNNGQTDIEMDIFPFKMTDANLNQYKNSPYYDFWKQLQPGYLYFEKYHLPPTVEVVNGRYVIKNSAGLIDKTQESSTINNNNNNQKHGFLLH